MIKRLFGIWHRDTGKTVTASLGNASGISSGASSNVHVNDVDRVFRITWRPRFVLLIAGLVVAIFLAACTASLVIAGVKIIVIQPMPSYPDGAVLLLRVSAAFNFLDSPDAICERENGDATLMCRDAVLSVIERSAVIARLLYFDALYQATGAPSDMR